MKCAGDGFVFERELGVEAAHGKVERGRSSGCIIAGGAMVSDGDQE